jgi:eukaryotic-like serine/threonine-protein kinase
MHTHRWAVLSPLLDELLEISGEARQIRLHQLQEQHPDLADELVKMMALEKSHPDFMSEPLANLDSLSRKPNDEIGPYRLVSLLGEGGMGQVWLAIRSDGLYERRVALKLLRPGISDAGLRQRFTRERQILARLAHAHIARLLDAGVTVDGQPYLALDYVNGEPITEAVKRRPMELRQRLNLFMQVCDAVSHAHSNLIIHRDLKPSNILVTPGNEVKLLDFGIAKLLDNAGTPQHDITLAGHRTFTLHYAAPEQLRGEVISTMTDVYALGVVLYEMLAGCKPHAPTKKTDAAWEEAVLKEEPVKPSLALQKNTELMLSADNKYIAKALADDLDTIILKALSKEPEFRYSSVETFKQDLIRFLEGQPVLAKADSFVYRIKKYVQRHTVAIGFGVSVSTLLAVGLGITAWQASQAKQQANRAEAMQGFVVALFENSGGSTYSEDLNVRELLESGALRADNELANQPAARAELLGLLAQLRSGLGDDREALVLLEKQSRAFMQLDTETPDVLRLESLATRGRSLRQLQQLDDCIRDLTPFTSIATALSGNQGKAASAFYAELGRCHAAQGNIKLARDLFTQALDIRKQLKDEKALEAESLADLADLLGKEKNYDKAISQARQALSMLRSAGGERNALGVDIWHKLGNFYLGSNNLREAEAGFRQSLDIAQHRFNNQHPISEASQFALANILIEKNQLNEASVLLASAREHRLRQWGNNHPRIAEISHLQAVVAFERSNFQDSIAFANEASTIWLSARKREPYLASICLAARAQSAQNSSVQQAEKSAGQCLAIADQYRSENLQSIAIEMADVALDHSDFRLAETRLMIAQQVKKTNTPEMLVTWLRLQEQSNSFALSEEAFLKVEKTTREQRNSAAKSMLLSKVSAIHANFLCRNNEKIRGRQLSEKILQEHANTAPERTRQYQQLLLISNKCNA